MARIGLVLSAGGSVGLAYHGAVLAAIEEATGWDPRRAAAIVGTSAGSLTAAMLRLGLPASDLAAISEGRPLSAAGSQLAARGFPHRPRIFTPSLFRLPRMADPAAVLRGVFHPGSMPLPALLAAALPAGLVPTDSLSAGIDRAFAGRWPAGTYVCAGRLGDGQRVVFGAAGGPPAPIGRAVAASCAVPAYYAPVEIGGQRYVDGGVHSIANLDVVTSASVHHQPLDLVIVSAPMAQAAPHFQWGVDGFLRHSLRAQVYGEARRGRRSGVEVVVIAPGAEVIEAMGLNPMDARPRSRVSRAARREMARYLVAGEGRHLAEALAAQASAARPA